MKFVPAAVVGPFIESDAETATPVGADSRLTAFRGLYENHQMALRRTLSGIVGREHCDDLIQEVFLRAWRSWDNFRGDSQVKTWLHRIAVNAALDSKKKMSPVLVENFDTEMSPDDDPERENLLADLIEKGLAVLSEEQRTAFVLYYRSEFSVEEIAETLEIPEGTVKSRLFKGRERFVEFLRRNGVQDGI